MEEGDEAAGMKGRRGPSSLDLRGGGGHQGRNKKDHSLTNIYFKALQWLKAYAGNRC